MTRPLYLLVPRIRALRPHPGPLPKGEGDFIFRGRPPFENSWHSSWTATLVTEVSGGLERNGVQTPCFAALRG